MAALMKCQKIYRTKQNKKPTKPKRKVQNSLCSFKFDQPNFVKLSLILININITVRNTPFFYNKYKIRKDLYICALINPFANHYKSRKNSIVRMTFNNSRSTFMIVEIIKFTDSLFNRYQITRNIFVSLVIVVLLSSIPISVNSQYCEAPKTQPKSTTAVSFFFSQR